MRRVCSAFRARSARRDVARPRSTLPISIASRADTRFTIAMLSMASDSDDALSRITNGSTSPARKAAASRVESVVCAIAEVRPADRHLAAGIGDAIGLEAGPRPQIVCARARATDRRIGGEQLEQRVRLGRLELAEVARASAARSALAGEMAARETLAATARHVTRARRTARPTVPRQPSQAAVATSTPRRSSAVRTSSGGGRSTRIRRSRPPSGPRPRRRSARAAVGALTGRQRGDPSHVGNVGDDDLGARPVELDRGVGYRVSPTNTSVPATAAATSADRARTGWQPARTSR